MIIKVNLIAKNDQYEYVFFTFSYKKKLSSFNRSYIKTSPKIEGAEHEELEKRPEKAFVIVRIKPIVCTEEHVKSRKYLATVFVLCIVQEDLIP
jgi:hypothetical protein